MSKVVDMEAGSKTDNLIVYGIQRGVTEESHLELRDSLNYVKMHNTHQMKFDQVHMISIKPGSEVPYHSEISPLLSKK